RFARGGIDRDLARGQTAVPIGAVVLDVVHGRHGQRAGTDTGTGERDRARGRGARSDSLQHAAHGLGNVRWGLGVDELAAAVDRRMPDLIDHATVVAAERIAIAIPVRRVAVRVVGSRLVDLVDLAFRTQGDAIE